MSDAIIYDLKTGKPLQEPPPEPTDADMVAEIHEAFYRFTGRRLAPQTPELPPPPTASQRRKLLAMFNSGSPQMREFLMLYCQALRRDVPAASSGSPDAEAIQHCNRLRDVCSALEAAYPAIPEDEPREIAIEPLDREWWDVTAQLFKLPPPTTREGVRAAARMMLSYCNLDTYATAVESGDVLIWLSRACAEYLASPA